MEQPLHLGPRKGRTFQPPSPVPAFLPASLVLAQVREARAGEMQQIPPAALANGTHTLTFAPP